MRSIKGRGITFNITDPTRTMNVEGVEMIHIGRAYVYVDPESYYGIVESEVRTHPYNENGTGSSYVKGESMKVVKFFRDKSYVSFDFYTSNKNMKSVQVNFDINIVGPDQY